jgi:hypothetical protein
VTHHVTTMLQSYPKDMGSIDQQQLAECVETCFEYAQTCTACADACLARLVPADRGQRADDQRAAGGLSRRLPGLRAGVRATCADARALPSVRGPAAAARPPAPTSCPAWTDS